MRGRWISTPSTAVPPRPRSRQNASGDARISWTPPDGGFHDPNVYGTTVDGIILEYTDYYFSVN